VFQIAGVDDLDGAGEPVAGLNTGEQQVAVHLPIDGFHLANATLD
jgi:hypothetical protein